MEKLDPNCVRFHSETRPSAPRAEELCGYLSVTPSPSAHPECHHPHCAVREQNKMFAYLMPDQSLVSTVYQELSQLNNKKNLQFKKNGQRT